MQCGCGFDNPPEANFCVACGAQIRSPMKVKEATAVAPPPRAPVARPRLTGKAKAIRTTCLLAVLILLGGIYWWRNRSLGWYQQDPGGLYRFRENGKSGFMDRSGHTVIQPQFDDALDFSEGLAWVRVGRKVGFIDRAGRIVITPQFDDAQSFAYGRAGVKLCCGGWGERHFGDKYGFIDSDGKYIGPPEFMWVGQFSGARSTDLAPAVFSMGQVGFISRSAKTLIPPSFEDTSIFGFIGGPAPARKDGKWGYIDRSGKWAIEPQFDMAWNFAAGLAPVGVSGKWGFIDSSGKFVVNPQFDAAFYFDSGYAPVRVGTKWTLIDSKGTPVTGIDFLDVASIATEGSRPIRTADGWGFVRGNKIAIRPLFDAAAPFMGGLARVTIGGQETYIDKGGAYIGDPFKGRAIRPAHAVQEVWEGDVTAPNWTTHERFVFIREGPQIRGYYSGSFSDPAALGNLADIAAEVKPNDTLRLVSDNGFIWKGRFVAPVVITGTRPNGEEGNAPEFPFRLHFVREATPADLPQTMQPTTGDWEAFLSKFKEAITQRDQAVLTPMLGRAFYLQNARLRSADDVFRQLNWQQIAKTLTDGTTSGRNSALGRSQNLITDAHPCPNCVYQVTLTFAEDADGQWRWTGVTYPGD